MKILGRSLLWLVSLLLLMGAGLWTLDKLHPVTPLFAIAPSQVVLDREGEVLRHYATKEGIFRHEADLQQLSAEYLALLLLYEDRHFFRHPGVNPFATLRALWQWISHGRIISGSSTLTMQVARLLHPHKRTLYGKVTQMLRALQLEYHHSKAEILTAYLNLAPMGGNIEGVETASWRYFGKRAKALTLTEAAMLVALPQKPTALRPDLHPQRAKEARNRVLTRAATTKKMLKIPAGSLSFQSPSETLLSSLTPETLPLFTTTPLNLSPQKTQQFAPHFSDIARQTFPEQALISTTLQKPIQIAFEEHLNGLKPTLPPRLSAAFVLMHNPTQSVTAYGGSLDLLDASRFGFINMVEAIRSPGSTLKPFAYGMALDRGIVHEASLLTDTRRSFLDYAPKNFDKQFRGAIPLNEALQRSLNVPVVQVFNHLTPRYFVERIQATGITLQSEEPNLTLILGGGGISLFEQTRLYASLANGGVVPEVKMFLKKPKRAEALSQSASTLPKRARQLLSEEASWLIYTILSDVRPPTRMSRRKIAWKTGTSYGYRDGFALGVSHDWTLGVWLGRPDSVPTPKLLAGDLALPLLFDLFALLPHESAKISQPAGIIPLEICWPSGRERALLPEKECTITHTIRSIRGMAPPTLFDAPHEIKLTHQSWPSALKNSPLQQSVMPLSHRRELTQRETRRAPEILNLSDGAELFKPASENGLQASSDSQTPLPQLFPLIAAGNAPFRWYLEGHPLPHSSLDLAQLTPGEYRLTVEDSYGETATLTFTIVEF